jgi:steroid 5-alpha reductase family enzyme
LAAAWPAAVGALAVLYASLGDGAPVRRSAIAWMMGSWGARLAVQQLYTRTSDFPLSLRRSYVVLLTSVVAFSTPALFASLNPEPSLSPVELGAAAIWVFAFAGETTADRQRLRFLADPAHAGLRCRAGIWRVLPRAHAVFEVMVWSAFALFASASPWGWISAACPAAVLYLLTRRC